MTRDMLYINGSWTASSGESALLVENPTSEEIIGSVPDGTIQDTDLAVKPRKMHLIRGRSRRFKKESGFFMHYQSHSKRGQRNLLRSLPRSWDSHRILQNRDGRDTEGGFEKFAKLLDSYEWEEEVRNSIIVKEPIGVCAFITPWNFPLHQIIGKVAPAIAAGCTMILKPSREAPINAFILADILHEIGLPDGVFNLVSGRGSTVGSRLSSHPDVDMISFTGSTSAGIAVTEDAARTVKRVTLELGEKVQMLYWKMLM